VATKAATKSSPPQKTAPKKVTSKSEHPAAEGIPLPSDPSAVHLQEEQDELQQPGRVSKAVADQIDNDPGYSKDQLAHMAEYWSGTGAVGEEVTSDGDTEAGSGD
jgi:hypothetical protein